MSTSSPWVYFLIFVFVSLVLPVAGYKFYGFIHLRCYGVSGFKPKKFLTANEVDFFLKLRQAAGTRWLVFPQVSMGALIDTTMKPAHSGYWAERAKFSGKICDFVICDALTLAPQLVVELDDVMHDFKKDIKRDSLSARAGYRTLRFWSRKKPNVTELKRQLEKALALNI
jgi:hypothetical protein